MASNVWLDNNGNKFITGIEAKAWRLESRGHTLLEKLLNQRMELCGSRFSKPREPGLWYGSLDVETAFAEKAFYTFNLLHEGDVGVSNTIEYSLMLVAAQIKTDYGILLNQEPFNEFSALISSPHSYRTSQDIGAAMRAAKVEAFVYDSARDPENGPNIALFTPRALREIGTASQTWRCIASKDVVRFVPVNDIKAAPRHFPIDLFLVEGDLPVPA